jgi:hypothetical protein
VKLTRVDPAALRAATEDLRTQLVRLRAVLEPLLVTDLTEEERAETLRPPVRMFDAARDVANNAGEFPHVLAATGYEPQAVLEDLDNHATLAGLAESLEELKQWVGDSRLVWAGEIYQQTLALYNVGQALAKHDGSVRPLIEPVAEVFASRRKRKDG